RCSGAPPASHRERTAPPRRGYEPARQYPGSRHRGADRGREAGSRHRRNEEDTMNELATTQHLEWVETRRTRVGGTAPRESASRVSSSVARAVVMSPGVVVVARPKLARGG